MRKLEVLMAESTVSLTEHLLQEHSDEKLTWPHKRRQLRSGHHITIGSVCLAFLCLVATNIYLLSQCRSLRKEQHSAPSTFCSYLLKLMMGQADSDPAGIKYDTPTAYSLATEYLSANETLTDDLWDNLDMNSLVVALDDKWAVEHGLPISVFRFPWDQETKGVYFLKVYHGLHCLVRLCFYGSELQLPNILVEELT